MKIVVNHLTRMQPGYVCVAGIDLQTNAHVRPVLANRRLTTDLLKRNGGPFDIGVVVDLESTQHRGGPPEVEDYVFDSSNASAVRELSSDRFWKLLKGLAQTKLSKIFGSDLKSHGRGCAVDVGTGTASLGCLVPSRPPQLEINSYDKVRINFTDGAFTVDLSVTDLRFVHQDQQRPRSRVVQDVQARINNGIGVILSVGLARAWRKPGDTAPRHWLQVNNVHLEDDPTWQVV